MASNLRPNALRPGDTLAVAVFSNGLDPEEVSLLERGIGNIESLGFHVQRSPLVVPGRSHWWAGASLQDTATELNRLLRDPAVRGIVGLDGGRWVFGYLDLIDLEAVRADPKPIVGSSDVSALLLALYSKAGLTGFHGDMAVRQFAEWDDLDADRRVQLGDTWRRVLTGDASPVALPADGGWECWRSGRAEGPLIGAMLNRLVRIQASGWALTADQFDGAILFWEEAFTSTTTVWYDLNVLPIGRHPRPHRWDARGRAGPPRDPGRRSRSARHRARRPRRSGHPRARQCQHRPRRPQSARAPRGSRRDGRRRDHALAPGTGSQCILICCRPWCSRRAVLWEAVDRLLGTTNGPLGRGMQHSHRLMADRIHLHSERPGQGQVGGLQRRSLTISGAVAPEPIAGQEEGLRRWETLFGRDDATADCRGRPATGRKRAGPPADRCIDPNGPRRCHHWSAAALCQGGGCHRQGQKERQDQRCESAHCSCPPASLRVASPVRGRLPSRWDKPDGGPLGLSAGSDYHHQPLDARQRSSNQATYAEAGPVRNTNILPAPRQPFREAPDVTLQGHYMWPTDAMAGPRPPPAGGIEHLPDARAFAETTKRLTTGAAASVVHTNTLVSPEGLEPSTRRSRVSPGASVAVRGRSICARIPRIEPGTPPGHPPTLLPAVATSHPGRPGQAGLTSGTARIPVGSASIPGPRPQE